ncbi:MAG TPA: 3-deoxy-D-manno-octulosonic acid transferase [Pyrinomonadaceae bacterium]
MYLLYSILLTLGVVVLLPRFLLDALRHGKYVAGLGERLGKVPALERDGRPVVWLHSVSVGETQAARPLVQELRQRFPNYKLVVSTITLTGQRVAREVFRNEAALVFYFPFDWRWTVRRTLRAINPAVVLIMETELWPGFLRECRRRKIRTAMVNGRLSERSFRRYRLLRSFISRVVCDLDLALMQAEADAARIRALGLAPERVQVTGNIKFDASVDASEQGLTAELRARFALGNERPLIVAASTHAPEERIVIEAFKEASKASAAHAPRLLIAPRHPERFAETASLLNNSGLTWSRRSAVTTASDKECDAILLDSIGELRAVYPLAEMVFVGGSIAPVGGHNVLEPAAAGKCIVTGAHTFNFAAIMRVFTKANALVELPPVTDDEAVAALSTVFSELLADKERRQELAARALSIMKQNRGATERTVEMLGVLMDEK